MKINCPICGKEGSLEPHPTQKERVILNCSCNPSGPVFEADAPVKKEIKNDRTN